MSQILTIVRGSDVTIPFTITGVNLTGQTLFFTIKATGSVDASDSSDATALSRYTSTSHTDPVNGVTSVQLLGSAVTPANTSNLTPSTYEYDVWTKDANGVMTPRTSGPQQIKVVSTVTQRRS